MEVYSDADEILQEEINQYKVTKRGYYFRAIKCMSSVDSLATGVGKAFWQNLNHQSSDEVMS